MWMMHETILYNAWTNIYKQVPAHSHTKSKYTMAIPIPKFSLT
jgi:hypothetical protein